MRRDVHQFTTALIALVLAACAGPAAERPATAPRRAPPALSPTPEPLAAMPTPRAVEVARVTFAAVGDMLPHAAVHDAAASAAAAGAAHEGWSALLEGARHGLESADVAFANLETPVAPETGRKVEPFQYRFNAPASLLAALREIGVDVVSLANNHVYDQGRTGLVESLRHLQASGIKQVGAGATCDEAAAPVLVDAGTIRLALIGATALLNQDLNAGPADPCVSLLDEGKVLASTRRARELGAELVILSVHWGHEYEEAPRPEQIARAHRLLDGGVDVILGHHPHVLQPVEIHRAPDGRITLVAYSLGNFLSNQSRTYEHGVQPAAMGNPRDGVVLHFAAVRKDYGGELRTELADVWVEPLWTDNNGLVRESDPRVAPAIRVVSTDRELERIRAELREVKDPARRTELLRRVGLLEDRRRAAGAVLGADLLRRPPPSR